MEYIFFALYLSNAEKIQESLNTKRQEFVSKDWWHKLAKVSSQDYIDPGYKRLMNSKRGLKQIIILRTLAKGVVTKKEIVKKAGLNASEVRELLKTLARQGYIERHRKISKIRRNRGRPYRVKLKSEMDTGRPPDYYSLTGDGIWLMGLDPVVREGGGISEEIREKVVGHSGFHSFADLIYAIRKHPKLRKFQEPFQLMDQELQQLILAPFVLGNEHGIRNVELYGELVQTIRETVRSEDVLSYYLALEKGGFELNEAISHQRLLLEKMTELSEVQEFLRSKPS